MFDLSNLVEKAAGLIGESKISEMIGDQDPAAMIEQANLGELAGSAENLLADAGIDPSNIADSGTLEALTNLIGQRGP